MKEGLDFKDALITCKNVVINGDQLTELMGED